MIKRTLAVLCALCMLVGVLPSVSYAAEPTYLFYNDFNNDDVHTTLTATNTITMSGATWSKTGTNVLWGVSEESDGNNYLEMNNTGSAQEIIFLNGIAGSGCYTAEFKLKNLGTNPTAIPMEFTLNGATGTSQLRPVINISTSSLSMYQNASSMANFPSPNPTLSTTSAAWNTIKFVMGKSIDATDTYGAYIYCNDKLIYSGTANNHSITQVLIRVAPGLHVGIDDLIGYNGVKPEIESVTPANGATDVAADISPKIVFNSKVNESTLTTTNITLEKVGGSTIGYQETIATEDGKTTYTIDPRENLTAGEYVITVTNGILSLTGIAGERKETRFTVAESQSGGDDGGEDGGDEGGDEGGDNPTDTPTPPSATYLFYEDFSCDTVTGTYAPLRSFGQYYKTNVTDGKTTFRDYSYTAANEDAGTPASGLAHGIFEDTNGNKYYSVNDNSTTEKRLSTESNFLDADAVGSVFTFEADVAFGNQVAAAGGKTSALLKIRLSDSNFDIDAYWTTDGVKINNVTVPMSKNEWFTIRQVVNKTDGKNFTRSVYVNDTRVIENQRITYDSDKTSVWNIHIYNYATNYSLDNIEIYNGVKPEIESVTPADNAKNVSVDIFEGKIVFNTAIVSALSNKNIILREQESGELVEYTYNITEVDGKTVYTMTEAVLKKGILYEIELTAGIINEYGLELAPVNTIFTTVPLYADMTPVDASGYDLYKTYKDETTGEAPFGWNTRGDDTVKASMLIEDVSTLGGSDNAVKLSADASYQFYYQFGAKDDICTLEFDYMIPKDCPGGYQFNSGGLCFIISGTTVRDWQSTTHKAEMISGVWHTIKLVIDYNEQNYDVYIDGDLTTSNQVFRGESTSIKQVMFIRTNDDAGKDCTIYLDNIKLCTGVLPVVKSSTPEANASEIGTDALEITVEFNTNMNTDTLKKENIYLIEKYTKKIIEANISEKTSTKLKFTVDETIYYDYDYVIVVTSNVLSSKNVSTPTTLIEFKTKEATIDDSGDTNIITPSIKNDDTFLTGETITLSFDAQDSNGIAAVDLEVNGEFIKRDTESPYSFDIVIMEGVQQISAYAINNNGVRTKMQDIEIIGQSFAVRRPQISMSDSTATATVNVSNRTTQPQTVTVILCAYDRATNSFVKLISREETISQGDDMAVITDGLEAENCYFTTYICSGVSTLAPLCEPELQ